MNSAFSAIKYGCIYPIRTLGASPRPQYSEYQCVHSVVQRSALRPFSTWRFFSREEAKNECDWVVMFGDVVSVCRQPIKLLFSLFARTNALTGKQALFLCILLAATSQFSVLIGQKMPLTGWDDDN